jgi:hypothetical protein
MISHTCNKYKSTSTVLLLIEAGKGSVKPSVPASSFHFYVQRCPELSGTELDAVLSFLSSKIFLDITSNCGKKRRKIVDAFTIVFLLFSF